MFFRRQIPILNTLLAPLDPTLQPLEEQVSQTLQIPEVKTIATAAGGSILTGIVVSKIRQLVEQGKQQIQLDNVSQQYQNEVSSLKAQADTELQKLQTQIATQTDTITNLNQQIETQKTEASKAEQNLRVEIDGLNHENETLKSDLEKADLTIQLLKSQLEQKQYALELERTR